MDRDQTTEKPAPAPPPDAKLFQDVFKNMFDCLALHEIVLDRNGQPEDYVFLDVNPAFERTTGLQREAIIGKRVTHALPGIEKDPADWIGRYGRVALTGRDERFEVFSKALGRWYCVNAFRIGDGRFATIFEDVTEERKTREDLRKQVKELEKFNKAMVNREMKMIELKREIAQLKERPRKTEGKTEKRRGDSA